MGYIKLKVGVYAKEKETGVNSIDIESILSEV